MEFVHLFFKQLLKPVQWGLPTKGRGSWCSKHEFLVCQQCLFARPYLHDLLGQGVQALYQYGKCFLQQVSYLFELWDFVKNPARWNFVQTDEPEVGDIVIQHHLKTGKAYHAAMIVEIRNGKYYINHAVKTRYIKHAELLTNSKLAFYRFTRQEKRNKLWRKYLLQWHY